MIVTVIIIIAIVSLLIAGYFISVYLNRKTKIPKGCEIAYLESLSQGCLKKAYKQQENKEAEQ